MAASKRMTGKQARDVKDGLDDLLADGGIQVVELRGVVPGKAGAVVAVVDVAGFAAGFVAAAKDDGGVGLLEVVVFDLDFDAAVVGEIGAVEAVGGIGRFPAGDEPVGMLDDPGRVDAHVVGHHVAGQANAVMVGAIAEVDVGRLAAEVVGDGVVEERVGGGDGVVVAAKLLDGFGGAAALPDADEPERVDAAMSERCQFFVGNFVEAADVAAVLPAELRQPHVGALGDEDRRGHPGLVGREPLVFVGGIAEERHVGVAVGEGALVPVTPRPLGGVGIRGIELHPDGEFFFAEDFGGNLEEALEAVAEQRLPELANEGKLIAEGVRRADGRRAQQVEQAHRPWHREAG